MRFILKSGVIALSLTLLAACSPTSNTPSIDGSITKNEAEIQRELAVQQQYALTQRAINVASPILMSNAPLCGKLVTNYIGATFTAKDILAKDLKSTISRLYGVADNPTVTLIANGSPAQDVLQTRDVITHINGKTVPKGQKGLKLISKVLKDKKDSSPISFHINRAGAPTSVAVTPRIACDSPVAVTNSDEINALADGKAIVITKGMMRFAADDNELATVIGHELAHNSRKHIQAKKTNAVMGTIVGIAVSVAVGVDVTSLGTSIGASAHSHGFETEADYVGLYHAARAGYNIQNSANLWRRMAVENHNSIGIKSSSHPSTAKRFLTLQATVEEINQKRAAGLAIVPEEKKAQTLSRETVSSR